MKTLVLHIGMAKTGTTTIQNSLARASEPLRTLGITCAPWHPYNHSLDFTVLFLDNPRKSLLHKQHAPISDEDWCSELSRLRRRWEDLFESMTDGHCIVSAENLPRLSVGEIQRLQEFAEPHFDCVRAIAYVRDPLKSLKSQWEQDVKEVQQPTDAASLLQETKRRLNYRFLARWQDCLGAGNLVVRKFEPAEFHNGSLLADFFYALGLSEINTDAVAEVESNQSLGPEGTAFLLALNNRYPQYSDGAINPQRGLARRLHLFYRAMRNAGGEPLRLHLRFNAAEAERFNEGIAFLNAFLGEDTGFDTVEATDEPTRLPDASEVSTGYYVELVNELAQLVDTFVDRNDQLARENKRLLAQLEAVSAQQEPEPPCND